MELTYDDSNHLLLKKFGSLVEGFVGLVYWWIVEPFNTLVDLRTDIELMILKFLLKLFCHLSCDQNFLCPTGKEKKGLLILFLHGDSGNSGY